MKAIASLVGVLAIAGCAQMPAPSGSSPLPFDQTRPRVYVLHDKLIVVDQEPIYLRSKEATITWELPQGGGLTFPRDGIVVSGDRRGDFKCSVGEGGLRVACTFMGSRSGETYKYTIKVQRDGKDLPPLDPSMISSF